MFLVIPIISVVGKSDVGKTTFLVKLIGELKHRGYKVAVIKHNVHNFEIDHPGKDTYRHAEAGADAVVIASSHKLAMVKKLEGELSIQDIITMIGPGYDVILTEGYKRGPFPKIEISRKELGAELICSANELIGIVTETSFTIDCPHFALDDAAGVADLIEAEIRAAMGDQSETDGSQRGALR